MSVTAFPLSWPANTKRTDRPQKSRFDISFTGARSALITELRLIGAKQPILSTNIELKLDGQPYARPPMNNEAGVAVYFTWKDRQMTFACDKWDAVEDNIQAIVKTINAIRGIDRWGSSDMIERAFSGFSGLPAPMTSGAPWRSVLNFEQNEYPTDATIKERYRSMAKQHHSDAGGNDTQMAALNVARDQALADPYHG